MVNSDYLVIRWRCVLGFCLSLLFLIIGGIWKVYDLLLDGYGCCVVIVEGIFCGVMKRIECIR